MDLAHGVLFANFWCNRDSLGILRWLDGKESICQCRTLGWEDPLEEEMATHSSIPAWRIPWTEHPGGP